jgi:hypothetical protein
MALAHPSLTIASVRRDELWADMRNSLGVARLLVSEGRSEAFVATVCRLAVESACRAALEHRGLHYDGNLERALLVLAAPRELFEGVERTRGQARLTASEAAIAWVASYLQSEATDRIWRF